MTYMYRLKMPQGERIELPGHRASRGGVDEPPAGKPHRGPGPQDLDPRIVPRSDHHHQPRGPDHRVQPGRRADLRLPAREGARTRGLPTCSFRPSLSAGHASRIERYLEAGEGSMLGKRVGGHRLAGQRRGVSRRDGDDHRPDQRRAGDHLLRPRHQRRQEGRRRAGPLRRRAGAIQPRPGAVRLRGLARPARATAEDPRLRRPAWK